MLVKYNHLRVPVSNLLWHFSVSESEQIAASSIVGRLDQSKSVSAYKQSSAACRPNLGKTCLRQNVGRALSTWLQLWWGRKPSYKTCFMTVAVPWLRSKNTYPEQVLIDHGMPAGTWKRTDMISVSRKQNCWTKRLTRRNLEPPYSSMVKVVSHKLWWPQSKF